MKKIAIIIMIPLLLAAFPGAGILKAQDKKCTDCHSGIVQGKRTHLPVSQGCQTCHQPNGQSHPQEEVAAFTLVKEMPDLCYTCHEPLNTKTEVHAIVKNGKCLICHTPHNSDNISLLKVSPVGPSCLECHDNLGLDEVTSKHSPVTEGKCQGCHDPHQSDNGKLLLASGQELCFSCHSSYKNDLNQKSVHPPFANKCVICHKPHGSTTEHLLSQNLTELCYGCHDVLQAEVDEAPVRHKVLTEGKSCSTCHSPHSSPNEKLVKMSPVSGICVTCHNPGTEGKKSAHGAVTQGKCTACHDPHKSANKNLVRDLSNESCLVCHEKEKAQLSMTYTHSPFKNKCSICHTAHASDEAALLTKNPLELCIGCHDDFEEPLQISPVIHQPLKDQKTCMNCHSPHASETAKILFSDQKTLCLSCHSKAVKKGDKVIAGMKEEFQKDRTDHGAITQRGCSGCHNPHYSDHEYLLPGKINPDFYRPAVPDSFAFCFTCHNSKLLTESTTTTATSFRDGDRNLHAVHINGKKGRNCTVCHEIHSATNRHLLKDKIKFGTWTMTMKYLEGDGGGTCQTGCHSDKTYKR